MEANWIEIKRFLNDYRKKIVTGAAIIAIIFAVTIYLVGIFKVVLPQEGKEDFEVAAEELLNDAQPAYFQIYIEYEDGTAYGNPAIINQYFNLNSIKEKIKKDTGIDIKMIEEKVFLNDLSDKIEVINVTRNEKSYLLTATFNLGDEQDNLIIAEYYYNLLYSDDLSILGDKKSYVFAEPTIIKRSSLEQNSDDIALKEENSHSRSISNVINFFKNAAIGFIFGVVIMIGIGILKVIYGKTLDYSFAYDIEEDDKFILYDEQLQNDEIVSQFVTVPYNSHKYIVTEKSINSKTGKIFFENQQFVFNNDVKEKEMFTEIRSLTEINGSIDDSEIIITIYPQLTTRKWFRVQKKLAAINNYPTKFIQINQ